MRYLTEATPSLRDVTASLAEASTSGGCAKGSCRALDDARTDALAELRGVRPAEHEWRGREGLV